MPVKPVNLCTATRSSESPLYSESCKRSLVCKFMAFLKAFYPYIRTRVRARYITLVDIPRGDTVTMRKG